MNTIEELHVRNLKYLVKTYDSLTDVLKKTKQRLATINPDSVERYGEDGKGKMKMTTQDDLKDFHNHRNRIKTKIVNELKKYSIYTEWLVNIAGIGPAIAANLILLYYYKFQPVCECGEELFFEKDIQKCEKCNKSLKNSGLFNFIIKKKDFANISKWWSYMGQGCDEKGNKVHRVKGKSTGYSDTGRTIAWLISEQFVKQKESKYREFYDYRKQKRENTHPNASKGHRHNMAKHEAAKIFLAHFWLVARTLDGKPLTKPYKSKWYLETPFYFDLEKMIAITRES